MLQRNKNYTVPLGKAAGASLACSMASCVALVVAAGRGTRLGAPLPKQYLPLGGRVVLGHALCALTEHPAIAAVRVIIHPDDRAHYDAATAGCVP